MDWTFLQWWVVALTVGDDLEHAIGQRTLQLASLVPWCVHPYIKFRGCRHDRRHRLGMDRRNDVVRLGREKSIEQVLALDLVGLGATNTILTRKLAQRKTRQRDT